MRSHRGRLSAYFLANVLFGAGLFAHAFLYNFYLSGLGATESVMGYAAAALTAGGLAALLPAAWAVDRLGARATWLAAAAAAGVGLVAGAFVEGWTAIYAAAFLGGAGTAAWRVSMGPLLMGLAPPEERPRAFSWNVGLLLASGAVWTYASGLIPGWVERTTGLEGLAGIRAALVAGALGTLLSAVVMLRVRTAQPQPAAALAAEAGRSDRKGIRRILLPPAMLGLVGLVMLWMCATALVLPFFNLYFRREHDLPLEQVGLLLAGVGSISALAVFLSGEGAARIGPRRMLAAWLLVFAPAIWGLGMADGLVLALALYVVQGFAAPATNPLIDQLLLERAPADRQGAVSGWRNAATEGSGLVGASAGGVLLEQWGFPVLFAVSGAVGIAAALAMLAALRRARPVEPATVAAVAAG